MSNPLCKTFYDAKTNGYKRKIGPLSNTSVFELVEFYWKITEIPDNRAVIYGYFYIFCCICKQNGNIRSDIYK